MAYRPLEPAPTLPENLKDWVRLHVDMQVADVHTMLHLPKAGVQGLEAGCNFAAASWLFNLLMGTSRVFLYGGPDGSTALLRKLLLGHYPWAAEGRTDVQDQTLAVKRLIDFRNLLAHSIGTLANETWVSETANEGDVPLRQPRAKQRRAIVPLQVGPMNINKATLSSAQVAELETPTGRPPWLRPTITLRDGGTELDVPALYWGTRRTFEALTATPQAVKAAQAFFQTFE